MNASSNAQQKAAGDALAAKRGNLDPADLRGAAQDMYDTMSESELEDAAAATHGVLPEPKVTTKSDDLARGD